MRKVSARRVKEQLPELSKQWQRLRYRQWIAKGSTARSEGSQSELIYPDFVILGSPKCGTSWLQSLLRQHPKILMVPDEIEYFSMHLDLGVEWYAEHFARQLSAADNAERAAYLLGERSARYCSLPLATIEKFHAMLPEARLILMARDPVSRHWAHAKKFFAKRRFRDQERAVLSIPRGRLWDFFEEMRPLGEFSKIIANWTAVYPGRQLLVLSQERTLAAPRATLDAVLQHLGLTTDYDPSIFTLLSQLTNPGPRVDMPEDVAENLQEMFTAERRWLQDFFGNRSFSYAA